MARGMKAIIFCASVKYETCTFSIKKTDDLDRNIYWNNLSEKEIEKTKTIFI